MGWDFGPKPNDVKAYMADNATYSTDDYSQRVLDAAIVNCSEYYAAVERIHADGTREVWCHVAMLRFTRASDYNFGKKDMCDSMGPTIANCPARILDLLTETDSDCANEWRQRCRARAAMRASVGDRIRTTYPLQFTNGAELDTFTIEKHGKRGRAYRGSDGGLYRIRNLKDIGYSVINGV